MHWSYWLWTRTLLVADRLFGTRLVEWELERRQRKIDDLVTEINTVNRDLKALAEALVFLRLLRCLAELKIRSKRDDLDDWLRFAPQCDGEESLLDSAIESLVKPRLAGVDVEPTVDGNYIYRLRPNWEMIASRLHEKTEGSELIAWLEEQVKLGM